VLQQRDELRSVLALAAIAERQKRQAEPVKITGENLRIGLPSIEEGALFDVLEKLAADFRKGLK
jgi:hypothetical protein